MKLEKATALAAMLALVLPFSSVRGAEHEWWDGAYRYRLSLRVDHPPRRGDLVRCVVDFDSLLGKPTVNTASVRVVSREGQRFVELPCLVERRVGSLDYYVSWVAPPARTEFEIYFDTARRARNARPRSAERVPSVGLLRNGSFEAGKTGPLQSPWYASARAKRAVSVSAQFALSGSRSLRWQTTGDEHSAMGISQRVRGDPNRLRGQLLVMSASMLCQTGDNALRFRLRQFGWPGRKGKGRPHFLSDAARMQITGVRGQWRSAVAKGRVMSNVHLASVDLLVLTMPGAAATLYLDDVSLQVLLPDALEVKPVKPEWDRADAEAFFAVIVHAKAPSLVYQPARFEERRRAARHLKLLRLVTLGSTQEARLRLGLSVVDSSGKLCFERNLDFLADVTQDVAVPVGKLSYGDYVARFELFGKSELLMRKSLPLHIRPGPFSMQ